MSGYGDATYSGGSYGVAVGAFAPALTGTIAAHSGTTGSLTIVVSSSGSGYHMGSYGTGFYGAAAFAPALTGTIAGHSGTTGALANTLPAGGSGLMFYTVPLPTGLEGNLAVRIMNGTTTQTARSTAIIFEYPVASGIYAAPLTTPVIKGRYLIVWDFTDDNSEVQWGTEDLVVREST